MSSLRKHQHCVYTLANETYRKRSSYISWLCFVRLKHMQNFGLFPLRLLVSLPALLTPCLLHIAILIESPLISFSLLFFQEPDCCQKVFIFIKSLLTWSNFRECGQEKTDKRDPALISNASVKSHMAQMIPGFRLLDIVKVVLGDNMMSSRPKVLW